MAIDKKKIKEILDGQLGSEVARNMKSNFDMLADEINAGEAAAVEAVKDVVRFSKQEGITKEQQTQAQENIGIYDYGKRLDWLELGVGYLPDWFKKTLVCYYNPSKQGLQNGVDIKNGETFLLKDFSPNHLDMTMHNFQGQGLSGMDGYTLDFNKFWKGGGGSDKAPWKQDFYSITFGRDKNGNESRAFGNADTGGILYGKVKIEVSGLKEGEKFEVHYRTNSGELPIKVVSSNGIQNFDVPSEATKGVYLVFVPNMGAAGSVTLTQLPLYPSGLVFDGVDDFGKVQNQLLTLSDYTVLAKRIYENSNRPYCLASKSNATLSGAFILETKYNTGAANTTFSFGKENILECEAKDITYQTQNHYNRYQITKGESLDTDELLIGVIRSVGSINDRRFEGALYSFLLFNRTLTPDEIDWVKKNIMGYVEPAPVEEVKQLN